jgi:hypothetical protein
VRLRGVAYPFLAAAAVAAMGAAPPAVDPASALRLGDGFSLGPARVVAHLDQRVVVYPLSYRGLPVFASSCAIQFDAGGAIRRASACAVDPPVGNLAARDEGAERTAASARARADGLDVRHVEPGWLRGWDGRLEPVIRVEADGGWLAEPTAVFYGATSLAEIDAEPLFESVTAGGLAFADNPATTPEPVEVELADLYDPGDALYGTWAHVERCVDTVDCAATRPTARPDKQGDFIYSPDLGEFTFDDPFAEVNAYHNITRFAGWLSDELGWPGVFGDQGWIAVKIGIGWYNAAYYGGNSDTAPFVIFGQDVIDMAYDADVACHEYGHAVNHLGWSHPWYFRDAYGANISPQGVEEGLADIWAETFNGDPVMNSYVTRSRTAANDNVCPDAVAGEGHYEARILSGFGWDVRQRIGAEAWNQIVYRTAPFLPSNVEFADLVTGLATSAEDLALEGAPSVDASAAAVVLEEAEARGLLGEACAKRFVPLLEGVRRSVYGYGRPKTSKHDWPVGAQWVLTAGEGDVAFHLELEWTAVEDVEPGYRVHLSRGRPVGVTWLDPETVPDGDPEFEVDADLTIEGAPPHVDFPEAGAAPLAPGEEVYVLFSADTDASVFVLTGTPLFLSELPPAEDAGPPDTADVAAGAAPWGMGCAAAPAGDGAPGLLTALFG